MELLKNTCVFSGFLLYAYNHVNYLYDFTEDIQEIHFNQMFNWFIFLTSDKLMKLGSISLTDDS